MRKIKFAIASLLGVIAVVMAFALGAAKVEAHSYTADYSWRLASESAKLPKSSGVIRFGKETPSSTIDLSEFNDSVKTCDSEVFTYGANRSGISTATIYLDNSVYANNTVTAFVYVYATAAKNITIGGVAQDKSVVSSTVCRSGALTSSNNTIVLADNTQYWMGIDIVITSNKSNDDYIDEAKDAIDAIPDTITDLDDYKDALDAATEAIAACENGINDLPEAYQTAYNNAKDAYDEALAAVVVDLAKDAIDDIPATLTSLAVYKNKLDAATEAIGELENGISDLPEPYQTKYNNAVATYNTAYNNMLVEENNARFGETDSFTANDFTGEGLELTIKNTDNDKSEYYNITTETQIGSSIFYVNNCQKQLKDSKAASTAATILGTSYDGRFKTSSKTAIKFTTTSAGAISFVVLSGSGSDSTREIHLYSSDGKTSLGYLYAPATAANAEIQTINVPSAGTYYLGANGKGINIYAATFTANSVKPLSQTYTAGGYTYIRFVTVVKGVADLTTDDFSFKVKMTYTNKETKTVDYTNDSNLYVVKRITSSGADYVGEVNSASYTFANQPAEYYVVFVLRLTTSSFAGAKVCSNFTYNGFTISSTERTI